MLLVTKDHRTYDVFHKQITEYFQEHLEVVSCHEGHNGEDVDLILLSSSNLLEKQTFPLEKIVIPRRAINIAKLEKLVALPSGTECLVVSNVPDTTYETIELLKNLGFNLNMHPHFPGIREKVNQIDTAVVTGTVELVPKWAEKIIDIGIRPLDFSTIVEISVKLNLEISKANIYSARYIQEIISLSRRLSSSLLEVNKLNHELEAIFNTVHDGIVATNQNNQVIKINRSARNILGISESIDTILGKSAKKVFPMLFQGEEDNGKKTEVVNVNNKKLVVNINEIEINNEKAGHVAAFQEVTRIQHLEKNIRKKMQKIGFSSRYSTKDIIGASSKIKETLRTLIKLAKIDQTVLIFGENGTGKELFAHTIHDMSERRDGPFIPVNFAGLPMSLAESELFGYEEGTFTGATKGGKQGLFELAHNGTIFLDEIGDAPIHLQTLLLRILQEKQVMRVGGRSITPVNVRVIAATNKDLKKMISKGEFREDLYYRLFVLPLRIPTLRERKEDIPDLLSHFIKECSLTMPNISPSVMKELMNYDWPGNIRELVSVVQYMTGVMEGHEITVKDLPEQFKQLEEDNEVASVDVLAYLEREGDLFGFYAILSSLYEAKKQMKRIGRGKVFEHVSTLGSPLTEQQIRRRMAVLRDLGLIYAGNKGKGSIITDAGTSTLKAIGSCLEKIV
jgi:transcriptional regulator with PAS, ATPase and Fis domain